MFFILHRNLLQSLFQAARQLTFLYGIVYVQYIGLSEVVHVVKAFIIVIALHSNLSALFVVSYVLSSLWCSTPKERLNLGFGTLEILSLSAE